MTVSKSEVLGGGGAIKCTTTVTGTAGEGVVCEGGDCLVAIEVEDCSISCAALYVLKSASFKTKGG